MVIARWQGELDEERFQAALDEPSLADPELGPLAEPEPVASPVPPVRTHEPVPALS
jgi:aerobic C4-dicarboxylate transport protein